MVLAGDYITVDVVHTIAFWLEPGYTILINRNWISIWEPHEYVYNRTNYGSKYMFLQCWSTPHSQATQHVKSMLCLYRSRFGCSTPCIFPASRVIENSHAHQMLREVCSLAWQPLDNPPRMGFSVRVFKASGRIRAKDNSVGKCVQVATRNTRNVEAKRSTRDVEKNHITIHLEWMAQETHDDSRNTWSFIRAAYTYWFWLWKWREGSTGNERVFVGQWYTNLNYAVPDAMSYGF